MRRIPAAVLASLFALAAAWGLLEATASPARAPRDPGPGPSGGVLVSRREVRFNGAPATAWAYRHPEAPRDLLDRLARTLSERGLSGRALDRGRPVLDADERAALQAGGFFLVVPAGDGERLLFRKGEGWVEALLRPEGAGSLLLWTERAGDPWTPDGGDCPGADPEGFVKPPAWTRLFCVESGGGLLACYASPEDPVGALERAEGLLAAGGWARDAAGSRPGRAFRKGDARLLAAASASSRGTQVSIIIAPPGKGAGGEGIR